MKKIFGLLIYGFVFGLSSSFCAGSMEATRLAEGVNFNNQTEVIAFSEVLRRNEVVAAQARDEGITIDLWIENLITEMTIAFNEEQKSVNEKQERERKLKEAEVWSSRNIDTGVILLDIERQQYYLREYVQNNARAELLAENYLGQILQFTGEVTYISGIRGIYKISLRRIDGMNIDVTVIPSQNQVALSLNNGDIITVTGRCDRFGFVRSENYDGWFSMSFRDSAELIDGDIRYIAE